MALSGPEVSIAITADSKGVTAEIARVTAEVNTMGKSLDGTNQIATRTFQNAAASAKEYLTAVGATAAQHEKLAAVTVASTRNMDAFSALTQEATGHMGEHALGMGRLEYRMATATEQMLGMNRVVGLAGASFLKFGLGTVETVGILAGIYAISYAFEKITESSREATKAQDDLLKKLEETERVKLAGGVEGQTVAAAEAQIRAAREALASPFSRGSVGSQQANLARLNDDLSIAIANRDELYDKSAKSQERAFTSDLASLVAHNQATAKERRDALMLLRADQAAQALLPSSDVTGRAALGGEIDKLHSALFPKAKAEHGLEGAELAQLHEAERLGRAAIASLDRMFAANRHMEDQIESMHLQGLEARASHEDVTSVPGAMDAMAVIEAKRDRERKAIEESGASRDVRFEAQKAADEREFDEIKGLNNRIEAENKRHSDTEARRAQEHEKKEVEAVKRKVDAIDRAERHGIEAMLSGKKSLGRELLKITLDPVAQMLEGWAAQFSYKAAAEAMAGDWPQAARDFGAAAIDLSGAAVVRAIGGSGGGSSGSGGGGGAGSGGGFGGGGLGAQFGAGGSAASGPIKIELVLINKDQTGREVARTTQMITRLNDLNMPLRISL